jgi:erythromycin esterase-like protein
MVMAGLDGNDREVVARIARPIHGERDLERLLDQIDAARVVLIGQVSHGAHELNDLRGTLTRKLIAERGFAAVAIAGGWSEALRVDRYVRGQGDDESAIKALAGFDRFPTWMWRNADVAAFAEWLAMWNAQHPPEQRAGFYGLDPYSMYVAIRSLLSFLDEADPAAARTARRLYAELDEVARPDGADGPLSLELGHGHDNEVVAQLVEMHRRHAARSGRTPSGEGWFHALQAAHVLSNAESYYRALLRGRVVRNLCDGRMADAIDMLAERLGTAGQPAKLVVWAHNRTVGDTRATALGDAGELALGQMMRQRHPGETALIGMIAHTGSVTCAPAWDAPTTAAVLPPSSDDSWEALFHDTGFPRCYVTAGSLRRALGERTERRQRAIGVVYHPEREHERHYHASRLAEAFDVVIHVDTVSAAAAFDRATSPELSVGAIG